jgi:hypothetical protein
MSVAPEYEIKFAGTTAVSWVGLTKVVGKPPNGAAAVQLTADPAMKLVPLTVRVNAGPPDIAEVGLTRVMVGGGAFGNQGPMLTQPEFSPVNESADK